MRILIKKRTLALWLAIDSTLKTVSVPEQKRKRGLKTGFSCDWTDQILPISIWKWSITFERDVELFFGNSTWMKQWGSRKLSQAIVRLTRLCEQQTRSRRRPAARLTQTGRANLLSKSIFKKINCTNQKVPYIDLKIRLVLDVGWKLRIPWRSITWIVTIRVGVHVPVPRRCIVLRKHGLITSIGIQVILQVVRRSRWRSMNTTRG